MHHFERIASPSLPPPMLPVSARWQEEYYSHYVARYLPFSLSIYAMRCRSKTHCRNVIIMLDGSFTSSHGSECAPQGALLCSSWVFKAGPRKARRLSFKLTAHRFLILRAAGRFSLPTHLTGQETGGFPSVSSKREDWKGPPKIEAFNIVIIKCNNSTGHIR